VSFQTLLVAQTRLWQILFKQKSGQPPSGHNDPSEQGAREALTEFDPLWTSCSAPLGRSGSGSFGTRAYTTLQELARAKCVTPCYISAKRTVNADD
jgi:hypothetical protein